MPYDWDMRYACAAILTAALIAVTASATGNDPPPGRSVHRLSLRDPLADHVNYLLYVPASYSQGPATDWPLIVFLHGSEKRGDNPRSWMTWRSSHSPMRRGNTHRPPRIVKSVLDSIVAIHRIDKDRTISRVSSWGALGPGRLLPRFLGHSPPSRRSAA